MTQGENRGVVSRYGIIAYPSDAILPQRRMPVWPGVLLGTVVRIQRRAGPGYAFIDYLAGPGGRNWLKPDFFVRGHCLYSRHDVGLFV